MLDAQGWIDAQVHAEKMASQSSTWRVLLFRALRDGDLEKVQRLCEQHPEAIHENFTKEMRDWELECDSTKWFEFLDSTCLYVASSHAHAHIVEWLLDNGVDADTRCYGGQVAADCVGECRHDYESSEAIKALLKRPKACPKPPNAPSCQARIGYEEVTKLVYEMVEADDPSMPPTRQATRVAETVERCKIVASWRSYWLPPGTTFELRHRMQGKERWEHETVHGHSKTLTAMDHSVVYEMQVRAQNSAGWSGYSELVTVATPTPK